MPALDRVILVALLATHVSIVAQTPPEAGWMRPPAAIQRLVESPPPPDINLSPQRQWLLRTTREAMPGLEVVARPHLKLAGLRIDPGSRGPQLGVQVMNMVLRSMATGEEVSVAVPAGHWSAPIWSADDRAFALLRQAEGGAELWLADPATAKPQRVEGLAINTVLGQGVSWLPDQRRLLVTRCHAGPVPVRARVSDGPQIQATAPGKKAPVRTYQDLLQNTYDEALFEHYTTSQLAIVDSNTKTVSNLAAPAMIDRVEVSPDGTLLLIERIERPFSFVVTYSSFPRTVVVLDFNGVEQRVVTKSPLRDAVPIGGVPTGPRSVDWLAVAPHTLVWTEALDEGDPNRSVPHRDQLLLVTEMKGQPVVWLCTEHRLAGLTAAGDGKLALVTEMDRRTRRQRVWSFDATDPARPGTRLYERSTQDAYGDPGRPISEVLADGRIVLRMRKGQLFLTGEGASAAGNRPFVDTWNVATGEKKRWFEATVGRHEAFLGFLDDNEETWLVRSESPTDPPALFVVQGATGKRSLLYEFGDPVAEFTRGIEKRLIRYEREDGVPLSGTLYLPPGYKGDKKLPCLVWAYPLEYSDASDAGQVRATPHQYLQLRGSSHLFLLLHGYAVFDDAAMPIVGPQRTANDTFVEQVQKNARAAVQALFQSGAVDDKRIAVSGHSYGAFMTANLLAHTDLFACGVARSGAYNRTLTPFGFQNEERTFWEAPGIYQAMSPFSHADKINEPLLLIHGDDDNNPGTFPIQSQRLFVAIKGHGGTARLCMLPHESHGYRARENVLHCLAEMCAWLDAHMPASGN